MGDLISVNEARRLVSRGAFYDAVNSGRLPVFVSATDRRLRLVRRADIRTLSEIRPAQPRTRQEDAPLTAA